MPKKKIDTRRVRARMERLKRHRAWITGYEMGSGKSVPFGDDMRMLHIELEDLLKEVEAAQ